MSIEELLIFAKGHCHSTHAKILLAELLDKNPLELLVNLSEKVSEEKCELYKKEVLALANNKPLQYVIGSVNFYGNKFLINENVLIPRFETEELVENTIKYINDYFKEPVDILDLGCGSGVIGLTLEKKVSTKSVDLVDISKKALEITKKNCDLLNSKANIIESDFFNNVSKKYDIIISNPPYIKTKVITTLSAEVQNEPKLALDGGEDGFKFYRIIRENVEKYLNDVSYVLMEIGYDQKEVLLDIFENAKCVQDYAGNDRVIIWRRNTKNE